MKHLSNKQLVEEFNTILNNCGVSRSNLNRYIKNHHKDLYDEIECRTIKLNAYKQFKRGTTKLQDISIFERIYCLEHGLDDRPLCKTCGKMPVSGFNKQLNIYGDYCSQTCQRKSPICKEKQLKTCELKYGKGNGRNKNKAKQTRIRKYGSHHPSDYSFKVKATKLERYGDENYVNVDKIKQTVKQHIEKNPNYYFDREQKTKATKIANGHDPNWNNREKFKSTLSLMSDERKAEIVDKRRHTCLQTYGVDSVAYLDNVKEVKRKTCFERYGATTVLATKSCQELSIRSKKQQTWNNFEYIEHQFDPMFTKEDFLNCLDNEEHIWKWRCKKCGHEIEFAWKYWQSKKCPKCQPYNYRGLQTEVYDYVKSICKEHTVRIDCKNILSNGKQLDIYIEDLNIAIEFNGCFWHNSDKGVYGKDPLPMMYHFEKSSECDDSGIRLIHIFEDEWLNHKKLCKSKLKKLICSYKLRHIDSALCEIAEVDDVTKQLYLNKYTFYGNDGSSKQYCLKCHDKIIAMMTFSKTRNNKQYNWQILNYIEVNSIVVDNGFDTLLNYFKYTINNNDTICYYASRDWENVNDYKCMKFVELKKPHVYWTIKSQRIKNYIVNEVYAKQICKTYNDSLSLVENMNNNGYYRIYDSGILLLTMQNE